MAPCGRGGRTATGSWVTALRSDRSLPVQVSGLSNVVAINGTAALKQDDTVWEWGFTTWSGQPPNLVPIQSAGVNSATRTWRELGQ